MTDLISRLRNAPRFGDVNLNDEAADEIERLRAERDSARAKVEYTTRLLAGIHALLYPPPVTTADGRTMVFRPKTLDPHEVLQELSDRIRALPDELAKEPT